MMAARCTVDICTVEGICENNPVADETACELGVCVIGSCEPVESVFPCTEQGLFVTRSHSEAVHTAFRVTGRKPSRRTPRS